MGARASTSRGALHQWFVRSVWATHNDSRRVREALQDCLRQLPPGGRGLNIGSGSTVIDSRIVNLDLGGWEGVQVCAAAEGLPFQDQSFDFVMSQETLEHVRDPFRAMQEMSRVLKPGGLLYCQVPFVIGYHPGPKDFWRFTREGIRELVEQSGLRCDEPQVAVGAGTGFYRVAVEFFAVAAASASRLLYIPVKSACALFLFPLKWLDPLLRGTQADRIPGGYFVMARKDTAERGRSYQARA